MVNNVDSLAESSARGSFILLIGNSFSLVVDAVGVILVARMLSPSDYGLYGVTAVLPSFFMLFSSLGINAALVRFIAQYKSQNKEQETISITLTGVSFKFGLGCLLSLILFLSADILSATVLRRPEVGSLVRLASIQILFQSMMGTLNSIFSGYQRMEYRAAISIIQSVVKGVGMPLLIYFGYGLVGAIIGQIMGYIASSIAGYLILLSLIRKSDKQLVSFKQNLVTLLNFGLPLFFGNIIMGFARQFRGFLLSWYVSAELIGNYGIASWFNTLISVFSTSISANLLPTFSKINLQENPKQAEDVFKGSIRYSSMVLLPFTFLLIILSNPIVSFLFGNKYPQAPLFIILLLLHLLFVGLGSLSIPSFLNSQGDTKTTMRINMISSGLSIILSIIFINQWSVVGLLLALSISALIRTLLGIFTIKKLYDISLNLRHALKTTLSCIISAGFVYFTIMNFSLFPIVNIVLSTILFIITYLLLAPILGAIQIWDISVIDNMLKTIKLLYPFTKYILKYIERTINFTTKYKIRF
jgi:O-antigen/teichoic acid export membrane protein